MPARGRPAGRTLGCGDPAPARPGPQGGVGRDYLSAAAALASCLAMRAASSLAASALRAAACSAWWRYLVHGLHGMAVGKALGLGRGEGEALGLLEVAGGAVLGGLVVHPCGDLESVCGVLVVLGGYGLGVVHGGSLLWVRAPPAALAGLATGYPVPCPLDRGAGRGAVGERSRWGGETCGAGAGGCWDRGARTGCARVGCRSGTPGSGASGIGWIACRRACGRLAPGRGWVR